MFAFEKLPGLPRDRIVEAIAPVLRAHGLVGVELIWRTDGQGRVLQLTLESSDEATRPTAESVAAEPVVLDATDLDASDAAELAASDDAGDDASDDAGDEATDEGDDGDAAELEASEGGEPEALDDIAESNVADTGAGSPGAGVTLALCSRVARDVSTALDVLELIEGKYRLEVGSPGLERRLYTLADYRRFRGRLAKLKLASAISGQYVLLGKLNGVDADGRVLIDVDGVEHVLKLEDVRSGQLAIDWQAMGFSPAPRQRAGRRPAAQGRK